MERWPDNQPPDKKAAKEAGGGMPANGAGVEGRPRPICDGGRTLGYPTKNGGGGGKQHGKRKRWWQHPGQIISNGRPVKQA